MTIRRGGLFLAVIISLAGLAACGTSQTPEVHRYMLIPAPPNAAFPSSLPIEVGIVNGGSPFRDTGIAYQSAPYRLDNYKFSRWVSPPVEMIAETLDHLARQPIGTSTVASDDPVMLLDARVNAFQQVQESGRSSGLVEIDFCLTQKDSSRPRWCKTLRRSVAAYSDSPEAAARAIDDSFNQVLVDLSGELAQQASIPRVPHEKPEEAVTAPMPKLGVHRQKMR